MEDGKKIIRTIRDLSLATAATLVSVFLMTACTTTNAQLPANAETESGESVEATETEDLNTEEPSGETDETPATGETLSEADSSSDVEEVDSSSTDVDEADSDDAVTEGSQEVVTKESTEAPTQSPTKESTEAPTQSPTKESTEAPTQSPTKESTEAPTQSPTKESTEAPTQSPTKESTEAPTKHQHSYSDWVITKEATCTEKGRKVKTCSCGDQVTESIPATGHDFGEWVEVTAATVSSEGKKQRTCKKCGETETKTISCLDSYSLTVTFEDSVTGKSISADNFTYYVETNTDGIGNRYAAGTIYCIRFTGAKDDYKQPADISGVLKKDTTVRVSVEAKYSYSKITVPVSTVLDGDVYYELNGKYYEIDCSKDTGKDAEGNYTHVITYKANGTIIGTQIAPWGNFSVTCTLSPIYTRIEN